MPAKTDQYRRLEIGFSGGQVLVVRARGKEIAALAKRLGSADAAHELVVEDGAVTINCAEISYLRTDEEEGSIGFAGR